jgi:hypothetical protein
MASASFSICAYRISVSDIDLDAYANLAELPARKQRFKMRLMRFDFSISHVAGKDLNIADTLSRAPVENMSHVMASASFSICAYRISVFDIDLDAYATGLRLSPRFCLITAPIPNDDASAETMLSLFGS